MTNAASSTSTSTDAEPSILEQAQAIAGDNTPSTDDQTETPSQATTSDTEVDSEAEPVEASSSDTPASDDAVDADNSSTDTAVEATEPATDIDAEVEAAAPDEGVVEGDADAVSSDSHSPSEEPTEADSSEIEVEAVEDVNDADGIKAGDDAQPDDEDGAGAVDDTKTMTEVVDVTAQASVYLDFFGQLANIVKETKLFINEDGWEICAVDSANVAMGRIPLSTDAFKQFSVSKGVLGIDLENNDIRQKIGMFDSNELVRLKLDPKTRKLHITGEDDGLEFTHALIDPETIRQEPEMPDMDWDSSFTLESTDLNRALKGVDMVTDYITLTSDGASNTLRVHGSGDTDDVDLELGPEDLFEADLADSEALYALEYMKDLNKAIPSDDDEQEVAMEFADEFPVRITYEWNDQGDESELLLAPRIQSN